MDMVYTHVASSFKLLKIRMIVVDPYAFFFLLCSWCSWLKRSTGDIVSRTMGQYYNISYMISRTQYTEMMLMNDF